MAEIMGTVASALTLAGLFKLCIESFDVIHTVQTQGTDLQKLSLKLRIEKCRLYTWGKTMGLTADTTIKKSPLDLCAYSELVYETMTLILDMFEDSGEMQNRYGCAGMDASQLGPDGHKSVFQQLSASFNNFSVESTSGDRAKSSFIKKTQWVIHDRKRFETPIYDAKSYIDSLQDVTKNLQSHSIQDHKDIMTMGVRRINDTRALEWLSEVDYPELSDAATSEAERITQASISNDNQDQRTINGVMSDNDGDSDGVSLKSIITNLEDMTVTELKYELSTFRLRANLRAKEAMQREEKNHSESQQPAGDDELKDESYSGNTRYLKIDRPKGENTSSRVADISGASADRDFLREIEAVVRWFMVLSLGERSCSLLCSEKGVPTNNQTLIFSSNEHHPGFEHYNAAEEYNGGTVEGSECHSEKEASDSHMAAKIRAIDCQDFRDETNAILSWFKFLSPAERALAIIRLRQCISVDPYRITLYEPKTAMV